MTTTTIYELTTHCRCPVDDTVDVYRVRIECVDTMLPVERILHAAKLIANEPRYQEEYTETLSDLLDGAAVTTRGTHSGVETTCSC